MRKKCKNNVVYGVDKDGKLFKGKGIILINPNADNKKVIKNNSILDDDGKIKQLDLVNVK
jgi:hypothetical protein